MAVLASISRALVGAGDLRVWVNVRDTRLVRLTPLGVVVDVALVDMLVLYVVVFLCFVNKQWKGCNVTSAVSMVTGCVLSSLAWGFVSK